MLDKLVQAAIITFLLYLVAGLNSTSKIPNKLTSVSGEIATPNISWVVSK